MKKLPKILPLVKINENQEIDNLLQDLDKYKEMDGCINDFIKSMGKKYECFVYDTKFDAEKELGKIDKLLEKVINKLIEDTKKKFSSADYFKYANETYNQSFFDGLDKFIKELKSNNPVFNEIKLDILGYDQKSKDAFIKIGLRTEKDGVARGDDYNRVVDNMKNSDFIKKFFGDEIIGDDFHDDPYASFYEVIAAKTI